MTLSNELLHVLPYMSDEEGENVYQEFFKMVGNHQYLFRLAESRNGNSLISFPSYTSIRLEEIVQMNEGRIIPIESHEVLQMLSDDISPLLSLKKNAQIISKGESSFSGNSKITKTIEQVNSFINKADNTSINRVPVLTIQFMKEFSLTRQHIPKMLRNQNWIRQLVNFFQFITDSKVKANPRIKMDSFLFNNDGHIKQFLMFNLLERSKAPSLDILLYNLKVFQTLILDFSGELYSSGNYRADQHNSDFNLLMIALNKNKREYAFDDFNEILAFLDQQGRHGKAPEKIAVFLDTANVFTGLHTYDIDFSKLLSQVFGEKKNISEQYAALFYPNYENESKMSYEKARRDKFKHKLESQGFHVLSASNGKEKAKEIVNGKEMDADDLKLIAKMRERIDKYNKILVMTGDQHFLPIMKEYEEKGVEVNVISIHPEDTSQEIVNHFKGRHHFITDYWESILI